MRGQKKMKNICRLDGHSLKKDLEGSKGGERTKKKASKTEKRVRFSDSIVIQEIGKMEDLSGLLSQFLRIWIFLIFH